MVGQSTIVLALLGAVALFCGVWCAYHVRREYQRRRHVDAVRSQLDHRPTVAELRERCDADHLPYYPTPGGRDVPPTAAPTGHQQGSGAA
jgi:hypothetical protein